jgi:hypothetical protein
MANAFHLKYTELNRSGIRGDFSSRRHPISPALDGESNSRSRGVTSTATLRRDAALQRPPCAGVRRVRLTLHSLGPSLHRSLHVPAPLTDQPTLPVTALATVLLALVAISA